MDSSTKRRGRGKAAARDNTAERRLLDAAELLFARHGYNGVSIRDIAAEARANISSVYYHFDSKQKLLEAVCRRRMVPVVTERKAAMASAEKTDAAAGDAAARERIADLIAAFVGPTFRAAQGQSREAALYRRLAGHLATDPTPEVRRAIRAIYDESVQAFVSRLKGTYARAEPDAFFWGVVCAMGTAVYVQSDFAHLKKMLGRAPTAAEAEEGLRSITRFIQGGLDAVTRS